MISLSPEMKAVLHIFLHDEELKTKALPYVDVKGYAVHWPLIFKQPFGSGHKAAILWAYCLWQDEAPLGRNPFEAAFSMDAGLRRRVLQALAIRWTIPIDNVTNAFRVLNCA